MAACCRVFSAAPTWSLNGVNVFSMNLVRGLREAGVEASLLLTRPEWNDRKPMKRPPDLPFVELPVDPCLPWPARWKAWARFLESNAPCLYLPNYDFDYAAAVGTLSSRVGVVAVLHSDHPQYYEHARRNGASWNAAVAVSRLIFEETARREPGLAPRLHLIPHGVSAPHRPPERPSGGPIRLYYGGVLTTEAKRIYDLISIMRELRGRGFPFKLTVAGDGPEREPFLAKAEEFSARGEFAYLGTVENRETPEILGQQDIFLLTSEYEGFPIALAEAMAQGCVPVVTDIRSGIPDLVVNNKTGLLVPVGDIEAFAGRIAGLAADPGRRSALSRAAHAAIADGGHRIEDMVETYRGLFDKLGEEIASGAYRRKPARPVPPPRLSVTWKDYLPAPLRRGLGAAKRALFPPGKGQ